MALLRLQGEGPWLSLDLRMTAGQLTWVGLAASPASASEAVPRPTSGAAAPGTSDGTLSQLAAFLAQLPQQVQGVHLPAAAGGDSEARGTGGAAGSSALAGKRVLGVWVQAGALTAALKVLVVQLVHLLQ
jgi:hypothetical protein